MSAFIVKKSRQKSRNLTSYSDFYATYYFLFFLAGHLAYFCLIGLISGWLLQSILWGLAVGMGTLIGAYISMLMKENFDNWADLERLRRLEKEQPKAVLELKKQRRAIEELAMI